jgi:hypothetical protein
VLYVVTVRKAIDLVERERRPPRGGAKLRTFSDLTDLDLAELIGPEPTPALAMQLNEECRWILDRLGDGPGQQGRMTTPSTRRTAAARPFPRAVQSGSIVPE